MVPKIARHPTESQRLSKKTSLTLGLGFRFRVQSQTEDLEDKMLSNVDVVHCTGDCECKFSEMLLQKRGQNSPRTEWSGVSNVPKIWIAFGAQLLS